MTGAEPTLVIIPTYNEVENIPAVVGELARLFDNHGHRRVDILVVDDSSPDGTGPAVRKLAEAYRSEAGRLFLLERPGRQGLARAYVDGFTWGLEKGYAVFVEMDADLSHDPLDLTAMLATVESHAFVVGSRYVRGGRILGWGLLRRIVSLCGCLYAQAVLGSPIKDMTGGYNAWREEALRAIRLDSLISNGYAFQIELKYRALRAGLSFAEIPITFRDRIRGTSKMSLSIALEAIGGVLALRRASR